MEASEHTEASNAYWSGRAEEYSALHEDELASERGAAFGRLMQELVTQTRTCENQGNRPANALEIGCGSGMLSILLAQAGAQVCGVDYSPKMLEQARANAARHGVTERVSLVRADAHSLPYPEAAFDLVVSRNVTWILDDVERVYAEALRALRPGGLFVNIDAPYGQAFIAADARGEVPVHPTQTPEQLQTRNALVAQLPISHVKRPEWDIQTLKDLGALDVSYVFDLEQLLARRASDQAPQPPLADAGLAFSRASASTRARLFMVKAVK